MSTNTVKLTELFADARFRQWLKERAPDELQQVIDASKHGKLEMQAKIAGVYNKISSSQLKDELQAFVGQNYSEAAEIPLTAELMVQAGIDANGVFSHYHPNLLRFPMQIMFESSDQSQLQQVVYSFMAQLKHAREQLIIQNIAYVEYVPSNLAGFDIPDGNWEIKKWKAKNNMVKL